MFSLSFAAPVPDINVIVNKCLEGSLGSLLLFFFSFLSWKDPNLCLYPHALPPPGNKRNHYCLDLDKCCFCHCHSLVYTLYIQCENAAQKQWFLIFMFYVVSYSTRLFQCFVPVWLLLLLLVCLLVHNCWLHCLYSYSKPWIAAVVCFFSCFQLLFSHASFPNMTSHSSVTSRESCHVLTLLSSSFPSNSPSSDPCCLCLLSLVAFAGGRRDR